MTKEDVRNLMKKKRRLAIDHWIYGGISLLWLLYSLDRLILLVGNEELAYTDVGYERIYWLFSTGFAWISFILCVMLGRLFKLKSE